VRNCKFCSDSPANLPPGLEAGEHAAGWQPGAAPEDLRLWLLQGTSFFNVIPPSLFSYVISFERDTERALSCLTCHDGKTKILTRNCAAFSHANTAY